MKFDKQFLRLPCFQGHELIERRIFLYGIDKQGEQTKYDIHILFRMTNEI
jgi:hypothetical protein